MNESGERHAEEAGEGGGTLTTSTKKVYQLSEHYVCLAQQRSDLFDGVMLSFYLFASCPFLCL
jgi:hypothetical protein